MKLMITYEDYLIWKRNKYSINVLKQILELNYNIPKQQVDDIDHNFGRTIEIYFNEKENLYHNE